MTRQFVAERDGFKVASRKTVTLDELRTLMGYTGKGLDHARIAQATGSYVRVGDMYYTVAK